MFDGVVFLRPAMQKARKTRDAAQGKAVILIGYPASYCWWRLAVGQAKTAANFKLLTLAGFH